MTKKSLLLLISVFALMAVSCVREPSGTFSGTSSKVVFNIGSEQPATKAAISSAPQQCEPIDVSEEFGIGNLVMTETVSDLGAQFADPMTKGTPIYTNNLGLYDGKLGVTIYSGTNYATKLKSEVGYSKDGSTNCWFKDYGEDFWPSDGGYLLFSLRAPMDMAGVTDYNCVNSSNTGVLNSGTKGTGTGTISFTYADPGAGASNSAELQKDLLFSTKLMNKAQNQSTTHSAHNVLLYHALAGVTFQLNTAGTDNVVMTSIDKVTLTNLVSGGSCVIKPVYEGYTTDNNAGPDDVDKSSAVVGWTPSSSKAAFSQSYSKASGSAELVESAPIASAAKTFMFIPQTVSGDVTLTVEYSYKAKVANGEWVEYTGNKATLQFGNKLKGSGDYKLWDAGVLYTYQFSINQSVDVDIDDVVDASTRTKSSLTIKNTGTATSYMRVVVIGNWMYNPTAEELAETEPDKVIPAAITPCTSFPSVDAAMNSNWIKGSDGFYYYKNPVPGGHTIAAANTLFSTVTFTQEYANKPYDDCHLEVDIAVQAIRADQVAQVWPAAVVTQLSKNVVD